MKIFGALLLVVACVHANSIHRYGWSPSTESLYRFESQVLKGIPEIRNTQYAGMKIMAQVRVQAFHDYTLRVKMEQPRFVTLNGEVSMTDANRIIATGGPRSGANEVSLGSFRRYLEEPIVVHLKRGLIENFFVSRDEPVVVTNVKRSLLSQLQLDVTGSQSIIADITQIDHEQGLWQKVLEESVIGKCHTVYNIIPMTPATVIELETAWEEEEVSAQLLPSRQGKKVCENKTYYEIIKTRDLDHCDYSPSFQYVSGADFSGDVTKSHVGNFQTHMVSSTTYACGELSDFTIRKIVVDDYIVNNPFGYNTKQKETTTARIMMELLEKKPSVAAPMTVPSQTRRETSLVYAYPEQEALKDQMSPEVIQSTRQIIKTVPVYPQPNLTDAPTSWLPIELPKNEIINNVVSQIKVTARELHESPEACTSSHDVAGKLATVSKYMQVLSFADLEQVWIQTLAGIAYENKRYTKQLLMDTLAMVGTNPATLFVLRKIDASEICFVKATSTIQAAMKSIRTPTNELLRQLIGMVKKWKDDMNMEKKRMLTPTLLQLSNLFYRAYVNPSSMVSNYPVRMYGIFGTNSSEVLVNEYIPLLTQMLQKSVFNPTKFNKHVLIAALGKLGHLEAAKPILEIAQGRNREQPIMRSLSIYSLKRVAKRNPTEMKPILLAIVNNPVEHADVRIAAIAVLPWVQPSYSDLQKIAVRSWYETSNQVASFARSSFESLLYTEVPELKPVGMKVKEILHMFKPRYYGLQFSKNVHISDFVRYLLAASNTEVAVTATKENFVPTRVSYNQELFMQVLGEGIKINVQSFSVYSQGMERAIDSLLKIREVFGDMLRTTQPIEKELRKIAREIQLIPRVLPESKALLFYRNLGYEYALELTADTYFTMLENVSQGNLVEKLKQGLEIYLVAATNLFSVEVYRPTEAGIPMIARQDLPSVLAAKLFFKYEITQDHKVTGSLLPLWNIKHQTYSGVVSPFHKELVATGVTHAFHTFTPIEGVTTARRGELDVKLKFPQHSLLGGRSHETINGFVLPFTFRKQFESIEPVNKCQEVKEILSGAPVKRYTKSFSGPINGEFKYESDNEFIDFYSYWQKIRQSRLSSYPEIIPFLSSVRKSSVKLEINPAMCELKEVALKLRLWTQEPSTFMAIISKPIDSAIEQDIQSLPSLRKALSLLLHAPASILKAEISINRNYTAERTEAFAVFGYNAIAAQHVKSTAAAVIRIPQNGQAYGVFHQGELQRPKIIARWNKEQLLDEPLEVKYNGEVIYGIETNQQSQKKIALRSVISKSAEQIRSVRESAEFKKCEMEETEGRRLSPICVKVRHQAGSVDTAEIHIDLPQQIYESPVLSTIEEFVRANFLAYYNQQSPVPNMPSGKLRLDLTFTRTGDVADVKVAHQNNAYILKYIRIPRHIQGAMPLCVRNPPFDWTEQKDIDNYAPSSCRIEPESVSTFDNKTYAYKINNCEHVVFLDGSRTMPVAVLTKTVSGRQKMVKVLSGITKVELMPVAGELKVMLNGRERPINPREIIVEKNTQTGMVLVEIKRYQDNVYHVYTPNQFLHILTDGKSIELVAPDILKNRAVGLCGNLNGEEVDCPSSPQNCIMKPKLAAYSYMLNKEGTSAPICSGIPHQDVCEFKREMHDCIKEQIIPTPIVPLLDRAHGGNGASGLGNSSSNGSGPRRSQGRYGIDRSSGMGTAFNVSSSGNSDLGGSDSFHGSWQMNGIPKSQLSNPRPLAPEEQVLVTDVTPLKDARGGCPFSEHANKPATERGDKDDEIADPDTITPNGCRCTSLCKTSWGADNFKYDWCYTNHGCGKYSFYSGYWDKCQYLCSAKPNYTALSWEEKQAQMWENILSDNTLAPYPNLAGIFSESMKTVFDDEWDVMPAGRKKYIHTVGAVCPFVVRIKESPFTGILQNGESHGLIRLSSAAPLNLLSGIIPGAGVKFFRSGKPSGNFVILNQLSQIEGKNHNFFAVPLSNHIPAKVPLPLIPVAMKFCQAQSCPTKVGLSDLCTYDQEGNKPENVVFPFKLSFVPTGHIKFREEYSELSEFMKQFTDLPVGTTLYTLRGHQGPGDRDGVVLGDVVTTDKCATSLYGDTKLFFRHQYIDEDKEAMPEWAEGYNGECTSYCFLK